MSEHVEHFDAPKGVTEFIERLDDSTQKLPKRLTQCAQYTRRNLHMLAVSTVSEMAASAGVAPSAYMRFCQVMGFSGYSQLQTLFRSGFTNFKTDLDHKIDSLDNDSEAQVSQLLSEFAESGHRSILSLANTSTSSQLEATAHAMAKARVVHLVGVRRSYSVVSNMSYLFDKLGIPAISHLGSGILSVPEVIFPGDVLFAVTYTPFSIETIDLARHASSRQVDIYGLSDSADCPLKEFSKEMLIAKEDQVLGFGAPTASIVLTTALAVAAGTFKKQLIDKQI